MPDGKKSPRGPWYDHKGFFEHKLANPAVYDTGKYKPNPLDRLRMPKPNVDADGHRRASPPCCSAAPIRLLPPDYMYKPSDDRAAIQKGWWMVSKYNCMGCHQVDIGQKSVLMGLPMYQGAGQDRSAARAHQRRRARQSGMAARASWPIRRSAPRIPIATACAAICRCACPRSIFSDDEIRTLVRFFEALSHQAQPFIPQKLEPLTTAEAGMARALFTSTAAPCLKCHATGDPAHDKDATAPNFLLAKERLRPAWTGRWITNPAADRSRHGHAFGAVPAGRRPLGLLRPHAATACATTTGDHADLLVRYMFQLTPEEQRQLLGRTPTTSASK